MINPRISINLSKQSIQSNILSSQNASSYKEAPLKLSIVAESENEDLLESGKISKKI
jgi:hypothetical protein